MCGVIRTFGRSQRALSGGSGSCSKTSSAAPPIVAGSQRLDERRFVDELAAADVDEHRFARITASSAAPMMPRVFASLRRGR